MVINVFVDSGIIIEPIVSNMYGKRNNLKPFQDFRKISHSNLKFMITTRVIKEVENVFDNILDILGELSNRFTDFLKSNNRVSIKDIENFEDETIDFINKNFEDNSREQNIQTLQIFTEWIIEIMHDMKFVNSITSNDLIKKLNSKLQNYFYEIQSEIASQLITYEKINCNDIPEFYNFIRNFTTIQNKKDISHLADIFYYQFKNNQWIVFVSLDYSDIVNQIHRKELERILINVVAPKYIESRIEKVETISNPLDFLIKEIKNRKEYKNNCLDPNQYRILVYYPYLIERLLSILSNEKLINTFNEQNIEYPKEITLCNDLSENYKIVGKISIINSDFVILINVLGETQKIYLQNNHDAKENDIILLVIKKQKVAKSGNIYYIGKIIDILS